MQKLVNDALIVVPSPFSDIIECSGKTEVVLSVSVTALLTADLDPAMFHLQMKHCLYVMMMLAVHSVYSLILYV